MRLSRFVACFLIVSAVPLFGQNGESLADAARRIRTEKEKRQSAGQTTPSSGPIRTPVSSAVSAQSLMASGIDALPPLEYAAAIAKLLSSEQFDELDRAAAYARSTRARFTGGGWRLYTFYLGLCGKCQQINGATLEANIEHLKHWVAAKPQSITPRVALAENYLQYAWLARGDDFADMVDDSAWAVFKDRLQFAAETLNQAATLKEKCPHWYLIEQRVARAQGMDLPGLTAIAEKASAAEPLYYYFYQEHAYTLQPRWLGEEGDSERYAASVADRIGGEQGDFAYYKIAYKLFCTGCSEGEKSFSLMSWPRIQKGYAGLVKMYGGSKGDLNDLAHFSIRAMDRPVALKLFMEIGENWERDTWITRHYFEESRAWALAPSPEQFALWDKIRASAMEPGAIPYMRKIEADFSKENAAVVKQCIDQVKGEDSVFDVTLKLDKDGNAENVSTWPPSRFSDCVVPKVSKRVTTAPPHPDFYVSVRFGTKSFMTHQFGETLPESGR